MIAPAKHGVTKQRGFTLVELVIVISLIAILSATAGGLFLKTDRFATLGAREQLVSTAIVAQKKALANVVSGSPVSLVISQTSSEWLFVVSQSGDSFDPRRAERAGATLSINGSNLSDGASVSISFDENAETGTSTQFSFVADNSHSLCIADSGFSYIGTCQP
jgi:MSHA pilin protein MshC